MGDNHLVTVPLWFGDNLEPLETRACRGTLSKTGWDWRFPEGGVLSRSARNGGKRVSQGASTVTVDLTAVIVAVTAADPRVLVVRRPDVAADWFPSGPLREEHRTLQAGLRSWVEHQTRLRLGHVEQLYTFGDRDRTLVEDRRPDARALSLAYLALTREAGLVGGKGDGGKGGGGNAEEAGAMEAIWRSWYDYLPWEDRRDQDAAERSVLATRLGAWARGESDRHARKDRLSRVALAFGLEGQPWDEERCLERYELLYEARVIPEAWADAHLPVPEAVRELGGRPMAADHRRILATAAGRLRAKIKYRPVLFELMPESFTLLHLQRTAEALAGAGLHKQNFRRLVEQNQLVEETGEVFSETGGRPAKLMRFRPEIRQERPSSGVRLKARPGA